MSAVAGHGHSGRAAHHFDHNRHHPAVEIAQHLISPLTASLTIFVLHKRGQLVAFKASFRAAALRARAWRQGIQWPVTWRQHHTPTPAPSAFSHGHHGSHAHHVSHAATGQQVRSFCTHAPRQQHLSATSAPASLLAFRGGVAASLAAKGSLLAALTPSRAGSKGSAAGFLRGPLAQVSLRRHHSTVPAAGAAIADGSGEPHAAARTAVHSASAGGGIGAAAGSAGLLNSSASGSVDASVVLPPSPAFDELSLLEPSLRLDGVVEVPAGPNGELPLDSLVETVATVIEPPALPTHTVEVLAQLYGPEQAQLVAEALSEVWSVKLVEAGLHALHDAAGLPWWATIVAATLALRTLLVPVNVALLRNTLRMKMIHPQVAALEAKMADAALPEGERMAAAGELQALFAEKQCSPWRSMVVFPLLLPPVILSIFGAVYNVTQSTPSMMAEGLWWFPDLTLADPTYLLPVLSAATWLLNVEAGAGVFYHSSARAQFLVRTGATLGWALSAPMPSGVFVFWLTSNLFAVARGYITRLDSVRKALGIPLASQIASLTHLPRSVA